TILLPDILIFGRDHSGDHEVGSVSFSCRKLKYDTKSPALLHLAWDRFDLGVPHLAYADSMGAFLLNGAYIASADSAMTIDSFAYASATSATAFHGSGIRVRNLNWNRFITSKRISIGSLDSRTWSVALAAADTSKRPAQSGSWQDALARSIHIPIEVKHADLQSGTVDVQLSNASSFKAHDLSITAASLNIDTGIAAQQPFFSQQLEIRSAFVSYGATGTSIEANALEANIQDSFVRAHSISYDSRARSGDRTHATPIEFDGVDIAGIDFPHLASGESIAASSLRTSAWRVSQLPSGAKSKKPSQSIWAKQRNIAKSISLPVRIGEIDLRNGTLQITGGSAPRILAHGARLVAVSFNLDSTSASSNNLFFSKDIWVDAPTFHYSDKAQRNVIDLRDAHVRLKGRSIAAGSARYQSKSTGRAVNNMSYQATHIQIEGIDIPNLMDTKKIAIHTAKAQSWQIERMADKVTANVTQAATKSTMKLPISIGRAILPHGSVIFHERDSASNGFSPTLTTQVTTLNVDNFHLYPPSKKRARLAFGQVVCKVPTFSYAPLNGFYSWEIRNLNGDLIKSAVTMDSLGYIPKYSEDEFAARHTYSKGRTDFRLAPVQLLGIDTKRLIAGESIIVQKFDAPTLWLDYYKDMRKPADPHPPPAVMPNDIVRGMNIPVTIQDIVLEDGRIQIREHTRNGVPTGDFTFQHVQVEATPITLDSASPEVHRPTQFNLSGIFVGQSPTRARLIYPLHDSVLNLSIDGTVGPFDATQLNQFLVNAEHVQVMSGQFHNGDIKVNIQGGVANAVVTPIYDHFKLKVLPPDPNDPPDIEEGIKTLAANLLVLRDDNPDEGGGPPKTGRATLERQPTQEFFQFLWYAIRRPLGMVVGGFK
ncbi:MAG: hypothetical protein Q8922_06905, partial [Bacteroidota bacterium]|nr:hypothetical protein [Bacteroidota bacterium]